MIRFIDLTGAYWSHPDCAHPICAFLSTSNNDQFITDDAGSHTFSSMEDIGDAEFGDIDRLKRLVPPGFFDYRQHLSADEAEVAIDLIERLTLKNVARSELRLLQRVEKWTRQACNLLRRHYT